MAAKVCVNHLQEWSMAVEFAQQVLTMDPIYKAPADHILGVAHSKMATKGFAFISFTTASSQAEKKELSTKAVQFLESAVNGDPKDYLSTFHLALQLALIRDVTKATFYVKKAIALNRSFGPSWQLLALLLSSESQFRDAIQTCESALLECTDVE